MTLSDAAGLAILALQDRRLVSAILRATLERATSEDFDALPARLADEPPLAWACRARVRNQSSGWQDELRQIRGDADAQIARATAMGVTGIALAADGYPPQLAAIPDPPPIVWVRGQVRALYLPAIGVVGSRAATPYALEMSKRLSLDLATAGLTIVSGLARGVDSAAHCAALTARGVTVGVLGCGIDRIYPPEHRDLARDIEVTGAVVSEFPPGVPPLPHHFPMRNRIISGLSLAVVVVEAPERSGALITASAAAEQGRDVLVVPGAATGGRNRGGHLLIRDGAKIVETADDILQELNISGRFATHLASFPAGPDTAAFTVDELAASTNEPANVLLAQLLELELAGKIQRIGGGRFIRVLS